LSREVTILNQSKDCGDGDGFQLDAHLALVIKRPLVDVHVKIES